VNRGRTVRVCWGKIRPWQITFQDDFQGRGSIMLDILRRGTVQTGSQTWEYHGDTADAGIFYITPQPVWATRDTLPQIQLVEYETSDELNGSGYCTLSVELSVTDAAVAAVQADIQQRFQVGSPRFLTLPFQPGTVVNLTYPDGQGGTTGVQADGTDFGSNGAIFQLPLNPDQMKTIRAALANQGGSPFEVEYSIVVPGQVPAVTMVLSFDSQTAFNYQVTAHEHTHWASSSTYTYDITEQLRQSNSSTVTVTKSDPKLSDDAVNRLTDMGQAMIASMVAKQVEAALQLQQNAGGTQSFSVSELSSFNETFQENEVILWRLQPQAILPSFGDLGLSPQQVGSLEPTVDKRQFVVQVTPQCRFAGSTETSHAAVVANQDTPLADVDPLARLDVTIRYPTLASDKDRTHTFTDNTPFTWQGDWDDTAGGVYSLTYVATYKDNTQVSGSVDNLDVTSYTLGLADIGTLNVTFDASRFFTTESSLVEQVTVDFVFNIPQAPAYLESATLTAATPQHTFTSVFPSPADADYFYTVTYGFVPSSKANAYTSDAKSQNGPWVRLEQPDFQQSMNVLVQINPGDQSGITVVEADINFYYDGKPYFPGIPAAADLPRPTAESPVQLSFAGGGAQAVQMQKVNFFANTKVTPLTVNATVVTSDFNTVQIGPFDFAPQTVTLLALSPGKQPAFISVDPTIVDWSTNPLASIIVHVTEVRYTSGDGPVTTNTPTPVQTIAWDTPSDQAYAVHFLVPNLPSGYAGFEFDWYAEYVYRSGTLYVSGTEQGTTLALPLKATNPSPPAAAPPAAA
jgi:hypothetical protein